MWIISATTEIDVMTITNQVQKLPDYKIAEVKLFLFYSQLLNNTNTTHTTQKHADLI
jgi:hypothetical protein